MNDLTVTRTQVRHWPQATGALIALMVALLIAAMSNMAVAQDSMGGNEPALQVGGEVAYTSAEFEEEFNRAIRALALQQGVPFNDETRAMFDRFRSDFLNQLATQEALLREAEARGITVTDEQVQQQIAQVRESMGGEEAFQQTLDELGYTDVQQYQDDVREGLLTQQVIDAMRTEIQVSDEEVTTFFEQNQQMFGDASLEDVRPQVESQLVSQRLSEQLTGLQEQYQVQANPDVVQAGTQDGGEVGAGGAGEDPAPADDAGDDAAGEDAAGEDAVGDDQQDDGAGDDAADDDQQDGDAGQEDGDDDNADDGN